ncbi:hypothetical protein Tco_0058507 [Tanacetum coccineum]
MLQRSEYDSWQSRMLLYIQGKEHGKQLLESVEKGPFQFGTIVVPGTTTLLATTRERTLDDLTPEEKIRQACDIKATNIVKMDDPNITMEEYIRLEEEKARRRGKVYNWETAKYGKIWYDEDVHNLKSVETEFPAIVLNDALTPEATLSCEPTVSPLNDNKIEFRISFDESDDEDYTVIFNKNSFSYKIISVDNLKTDSENDNDKVNVPSFPSPEPAVSYFNDFDFLKDFKKEFPAIAYNDALTSN